MVIVSKNRVRHVAGHVRMLVWLFDAMAVSRQQLNGFPSRLTSNSITIESVRLWTGGRRHSHPEWTCTC